MNLWQYIFMAYQRIVELKKLAALVVLVTLPAFSYGALSRGAAIILGDGIMPSVDIQQLAGDKSMATWFLTMGAIAICSWTWIFRWLLDQLKEQRNVNAILVQKLLEHSDKDNHELRVLLNQTVAVLDRVSAKL